MPRVWAILCHRAGENSQILALAEALGWPYEVKRLAHRRYGALVDVFQGSNLAGIDRARSSPLEPPWPDLIISAGMRNEPVCRWIQKQAGHPVRYVHIGRPWAPLRKFDLVVSVPEYRLPERDNVLQNKLSLTPADPEPLRRDAAIWAPRFAHLPRPYIAVLIGGYGGAYSLGCNAARSLARRASAMAREAGGSLLVTTSRRTSPGAVRALEQAIDVPAHIYRWQPDPVENPYFGYLALANSFIVTCDSATMLAEACATRRPVYMFDPYRHGRDGDGRAAECRPGQWLMHCDMINHAKAFLYRQLLKVPPRRMTRDIRLVHDYLIASGRAVWLGDEFPYRPLPPVTDTLDAVERVYALFDYVPLKAAVGA